MAREFEQKLRLVFDQMPGFWGCKNDESVFLYANEYYAKTIGLRHQLDVIGRTDFDMPCDTVAFAESFREQDRQVMRSAKPMSILDIHRFSGGEWKAFIVTKVPMYDGDDVVGIIFHGRDITCPHTVELGTLLGRMHAGTSSPTSPDQGSYLLLDECADVDPLTRRELEVLFFLIRGKSAKEIANLLSLSYRTIEQYTDCLKVKFDVRAKSDLIEAAILRGYMHRIPKSLFTRQVSVALRHA